MSKFIIAIILTLFIFQNTKSEFANKIVSNVYVCNSKTSVAYNSIKDCTGLSRSTHNMIELTEIVAIEKHQRRKCKVKR
ncbi:MAG: hypothetical protein H0U27_10665 [Nitrosopumilus sp.]|nr:hypothetical protein [Nitrosopumilus sp.]